MKWLPSLFSMYYTYILHSGSTGRYYIDSTHNLERRLAQHSDPNYKGSKTTKRFKGPWRLVYTDSFKTRSQAMAREKQIKSWKSKKMIQELIKSSVGRVPLISGINHPASAGFESVLGSHKTKRLD